ncbi:hypothetical protein [Confluentibacter sediminis]|uniref:hypothetical protein n=1 Tax=Confluentibacter sediminis TaxID=2219045 RepID=UPI000DAF04C6|nr:hypothetical protein [Confluentibacter sediminis]
MSCPKIAIHKTTSMETSKQTENYVLRSSKQAHYDKRLIRKIVQEVEAGLPRKEAKRIYKLGKSSLDLWMNTYGSDHYHHNLTRPDVAIQVNEYILLLLYKDIHIKPFYAFLTCKVLVLLGV